MVVSGIGNIATLLKRLEAATSRLEDIAISQMNGSLSAKGGSSTSLDDLESIDREIAGIPAAVSATEDAPAGAAVSPKVNVWDAKMNPVIEQYVASSNTLGGLVQEQAALVAAAFAQQRTIIQVASACIRPKDGVASSEFSKFIAPLQEKIMAAIDVREKNRGSPQFNQLSTISEAISALGWIAVEPAPAPFITEAKDSAQFYANRVIKEHKEGARENVDWVHAVLRVIDTLQAYVKENHTTGLSWNPKGVEVSAFQDAPPPTLAPTAGGAPPPPPPPAPPIDTGAAGSASGGMDAVFSQINQGTGVTRSLRKVDPSDMTHKYPSLRGSATVPPKPAGKPTPAAKPASIRTKKPASKMLDGNKWIVESFENDSSIIIDNTEINQTVNIFGCTNSVIEIKGKVNAVSLVSCNKTSVLLDTLVSSLEITRCNSFAVQITGQTPTVLIDGCDGGQIFLSNEGLGTSVVTAKSSALNVSVPVPGVPGEYEELALPEQLTHSFGRKGDKAELHTAVDSEDGIDVCLHCYRAACVGPAAHAALHHTRTQHALFVNIRRTPKPQQPLTKLAVTAETDADRFDYKYTPRCYACSPSGTEIESTPEIEKAVAGIIDASSAAHASEVQAWEEDIVPCQHTESLVQPGDTAPLDLAGASCAKCDLTSNLWLCLTCGHLGCGREQFGGVSGHSHGLAHFEETGHPVSVKQGTITPEGTADIYCYACNDARLDKHLGKHLAHFGIQLQGLAKTEKSMTELQLEQNVRFDFSMTGDDGRELEPAYGPGRTGIQNLGNTCYLASVVQALFVLPDFRERFTKHAEAHVRECPLDQTTCLECQTCKLAAGLVSGRYATLPPNDSPLHSGIRPTMFKNIVGKGHPEFASARQQDADEFLKHLVSVLQEHHKKTSGQPVGAPEPLQDPTGALAFRLEQRLECTSCHHVRYTYETHDAGLTLTVPMTKNGDAYEPVSLERVLELITEAEGLDYNCPVCKTTVVASKQTRFASFPKVLALQIQRFTLVNWVPQKADVPVIVPLDARLDLSAFLGHGAQPDEKLLPEDSAAPQFDADALGMLTAMGFSENRAKRALLAAGDTEAAANWLFERMDEDLDGPLDGEAHVPDTSALEEMGFSRAQAAKALRLTNGNTELAVSWLFENPDDPGEEPGSADAPAAAAADAGSTELPALYRLSSFVSHRGPSMHSGHYVAHVRKAELGENAWVFFKCVSANK
ncbi:ubiquitinyl hydrolase 1 [Malassezia cuniculi]|uniref:Adenylyl cyclase-associated protein n=1 Tax=Malassezia cuniculi TaxID=948313 RepID=A0AAF0ETP7_9BASI|nr:ubiquitinyl hydrolase 1 [Malassezia cuniculi]